MITGASCYRIPKQYWQLGEEKEMTALTAEPQEVKVLCETLFSSPVCLCTRLPVPGNFVLIRQGSTQWHFLCASCTWQCDKSQELGMWWLTLKMLLSASSHLIIRMFPSMWNGLQCTFSILPQGYLSSLGYPPSGGSLLRKSSAPGSF